MKKFALVILSFLAVCSNISANLQSTRTTTVFDRILSYCNENPTVVKAVCAAGILAFLIYRAKPRKIPQKPKIRMISNPNDVSAYANLGIPHNADCFGIFGLTEKASAAEVKKQFKIKSMRWHPDRPNGSEAEFKIISDAYDECLEILEGLNGVAQEKRDQHASARSASFYGFPD